ncbi:MAG: hypothetical protein SGPRY_008431, partial [Prymnesium sp.]
MKVVRVEHSGETAFFEFVKPACVHLAFFDGRLVARQQDGSLFCAEPRTQAAAAACCPSAYLSPHSSATSSCTHLGERVRFESARGRCVNEGKTTCPLPLPVVEGGCRLSEEFVWVEERCGTKLVVDPAGLVSLVQPNSTSAALSVSSG